MKKRRGLTIGSSILLHSWQQLMAFILTGCVVALFVFSCAGVRVSTNYARYKQTYYMNLFSKEAKFEDTNTFDYMLLNALQEIIRYNVAKSQLEIDGEFNGQKMIDVRAFANRKTNLARGVDDTLFLDVGDTSFLDAGDTKTENMEVIKKLQSEIDAESITATYYLEDLLKWQKYGMYYEYVTMTEAEFVTWFGTKHLLNYDGILSVDEQLKMKEFTSGEWDEQEGRIVFEPGAAAVEITESTDTETVAEVMDSNQQEAYSEKKVENYALNQVHQAFIDIMDKPNPARRIYVEPDGELMIEVAILQERYATTDNGSIMDIATDWEEYQTIVAYVEQAVNDLAYNYNEYQDFKVCYQAGATNIAYVFNMTMMGEKVSVSNLKEFQDTDSADKISHESLDKMFKSQYGRYMIYRPQTMTFESNTGIIEEADLFNAFSDYEYAYPETAEIWLAVDTEYPAMDQFHETAFVYESMQPYAHFILIIAIISAIVWLVLFLFLSVMTGWRKKIGEAEAALKLHWFDSIYTELVFGLGVAIGVFAIWGIDILCREISFGGILYGDIGQRVKLVMLAGSIGLICSMLLCLFWYSFIRRIKAHVLFKGSLIYALWNALVVRCFRGIKKLALNIYDNSNILLRCIGLVGGMLFANFLCGFITYRTWRFESSVEVLVLLVFTCAMNGIILYLWYNNHLKREEIMDGIARIKNGELDYQVSLEGMHGENKDLAEAVNSIGEGIKEAVETSMKDERLKADLITNVSHDIKTPLTSIVNYVDLLKREQIEEEPIKGYIAVLDAKSQRLKQLTDDLVEASKISSGNITLDLEKIDLTELVQQALGEFSEKFEQKNLQVVSNIGASVYIQADSRRIWRVMENLLSNICKYALEGTRVYLDMTLVDEEEKVSLSLKNISAQRLNIQADELTERFIRGDVSRSTEGSGLGLSIAKNLTELQKGSLDIYLDGDLFKVTLTFPVYEEK